MNEETLAAASALVAHARQAGSRGRRGSYTRLIFRLLEEDDCLVAPVATRMELDATTAAELLTEVIETDRLDAATS